jgi:D-alanyl-D-alanine carboxypeptidase (penicillin-binding protein 5/6)
LVVNGLESVKDRANEASRLIQWGLNGFENFTLTAAGETIAKADVVFGKRTEVNLTINEDIHLSVPKLAKSRIKMNAKYQGPLVAPIKEGTEVGVLEVDIPEIGKREYKLYTASSIGQLGFFARAFAHLKMMIAGETA